jgi:hypothetical protein
MSEPKPCPRCGRENTENCKPIIIWWEGIPGSADAEYRYECQCGAHTSWQPSPEAALDTWNTYSELWTEKESKS